MDALVIFEACRQGVLHRTKRRIKEEEKKLLCAGSVYVYDEMESGIKRWTDGKYWSPSRIVGDFLVYQELEIRLPHIKSYEKLDENLKRRIKDENLKYNISNKGAFIHRKDGLSKKTISVKLNGSFQHMVIYEEKDDTNNHLYTPRAYVELLNIEPGIDLTHNEALRKQNYVTLNDDFPALRLKKEKLVERQRNYSNITPIRHVAPIQTLPSIAEALCSPVSTMQRTHDFVLPEMNIARLINLLSGSQEYNPMEKQENSSGSNSSGSVQSTNCVTNDINTWQNDDYPLPSRAFPTHTYRTTVIPDTNKDSDPDFSDLMDFSRS
ncbi:20611_t:CDS:2 [Funneliformis geosporum]|uniref:18018_t:CDS:1 n=1 Tax=Funneliformis geosporum TaxID=1117311 RepID=A0A9W4SFB0_9GLOM|nr:20611_t:CDS:2 [Funneliformis geosporum]CAI2167428.1 18018_t:CDS:2 [Funneliformis geosporum]